MNSITAMLTTGKGLEKINHLREKGGMMRIFWWTL
jgi:hypothetical protein